MSNVPLTCPVDTAAPGRSAAPAPRIQAGPSTWPERLRADPFYVTRHPLRSALEAAGRRTHARRTPPGPRGLPGLGVAREYGRDPYGFILDCARRHGDVFRLPLPIADITVFNHPRFVDEILGDREERFSFAGPTLLDIFERTGAALPLLEGPRFRQRRKSLTPMFSRRTMAGFSAEIIDEFTARIDGWQRYADSGQTVNLLHEIALVTLPAFLRSMYTTAIPEDRMVQVEHDVRMLMAAAGSISLAPGTLPPNLVPLPGVDSVPAAYVRLRRFVSALIDERQASPIEQVDLLAVLLEAREVDDSPLSRNDLIAELIVLMGGGFDTVVNAVAWTIALLALHPEYAEALTDEVDTVLGGGAPGIAHLNKLTFTKACFDEAQRIQGGPLHTRSAMTDVEVAGFDLPRGALVGIGWYSMHRDPRWWPRPDEYDPTRFTDKAVIAARPKNAFVPFGGGPHHCIGSGMAYMNAQFLLALIAQRYRITTPDGWRPEHEYVLATGIKGGLPVTLTRR